MNSHFIEALKADDLPPGKMTCVEVDGQRILVANIDGVFYATDDTCTHEDASLSSGSLKGELVKCPLHGSRFTCVPASPWKTRPKSRCAVMAQRSRRRGARRIQSPIDP